MSNGTQVNGPSNPTGKFIDSIDPDDPEYIRNLQRPAEVKEDMKQMEGRSRVSVVLNSQAFKEELEAVIHEQIRQGGPASIFALQQISDLLLPQSRGSYNSVSRSSPVIPINDIRGVETLGYSKQEKVLRCKLAACYRLVDLFGWTHGIFNHISVRMSQEQEQFLVNPFGMLYSEMTASTLAKVDVRGEVVDTGSTGLGINKAGFTLHSAIHQARPDIRCIIHLHTPAAVAVSATKQGLLPVSHQALMCGKVSYHDYSGILVDQEERDLLARNLGPFNKVMFLRNHGVVTCGESIEEAFHFAFNVMAACDVQVKVMPVGIDNLVLLDEETQEKTYKAGRQTGTDSSGRKWRIGELEFEALMRTLDNSGYRTGHVYKQPLMKQEKKEKINSDVEVPPASSSFTYIFDGDYEHSKYISPLKMAMERQKQAYKAGWLTSPNAYKKQEIEEIGTTTPKKITKWVQGGEATEQKTTAIRVDNPNQFAPQGVNPKEFKEKQKSIKKDYYEEKVSAGPQSKILEGITWDEAGKRKDGDQTVIVGAASKGIIQRDHQHNAVVYRSSYSANPFDSMTEDEVNAYKQDLQRQEHPEEEDVPAPEGRLISTEERMQNIQHSQEDVHQDTEERSAQASSPDSNVRDVSGHQSAPRSPASPTEAWPHSTPPHPLPPYPSLQELGLAPLVDSLLQAARTYALPDSLAHSLTRSLTPSLEDSLSESGNLLGTDGRGWARSMDKPQDDCSMHLPPFVEPTLHPTAPSENVDTKSSLCEETVVPVVKSSIKQVESLGDSRDLSDTSDIMAVQLQPTKLFQGKPGDGMMRISFTIQSKVIRRKTNGPKSTWPVENVTIVQSEPKVMLLQSTEKPQAQILQEQQQNIIAALPIKELDPGAPQSPGYQKSPKKAPHSGSRRQGSGKLARAKKKFSRWSRRGLTHPLSPVREEFMEGEDTLEALLARQTVDVDTDESLEDLLLMTDDYKENMAPRPLTDTAQTAPTHTATTSPTAQPGPMEKAAPIATVEDLDENGGALPAMTQQVKPEQFSNTNEEPVFIIPKAAVTHASPRYQGPSSRPSITPPPVPEGQALPEEENCKLNDVVQDKLSKDIEEDLKFVDEEMSSTFPEASDGDIAPRKQEEGADTVKQLAQDPESTHVLSEIDEAEEMGEILPDSASSPSEDLSEEIKDEVESDHFHDAADKVSESTLEPKSFDDKSEHIREAIVQPILNVETRAPVTETIIKTDSVPKLLAEPSLQAPLACQEEDMSEPPRVIFTVGEDETKPSLFRRDSACLESSPIVSPPMVTSPSFADSFPPDPIHRELHRVRSLEDELDEPSSVQRRETKRHPVIRRVQSMGPMPDGPMGRNRNVAVIDAVLHTVTIDPAKVAQSGQSVAEYLSKSPDRVGGGEGTAGWRLMDSVSKSLEQLDAKGLAREGSVIYGRSLEVVIQDKTLPDTTTNSTTTTTTTATTATTTVTNTTTKDRISSVEDLLESVGAKDTATQKATKVYKDDVVIVTKAPMDFSAISPHKKDMTEEEGPLVTSSPKIGRKKDGSFKKYQSKMGKSEETLLEVAPVTPERKHQTARRTQSFPQNYGLDENQLADVLLADQRFLPDPGREKDMKTSSQSINDSPQRGNRRKKTRHTRNSDPSFSRLAESPSSRYTDRFERRKSEELVIDDLPSPARSPDRTEHGQVNRDSRDEGHRRQNRPEPPEQSVEQSRRRRRRDRVEEERGAEEEDSTLRRSGRERRRRRQRDMEDTGSPEAGGDSFNLETDRRRRNVDHARPQAGKDRLNPESDRSDRRHRDVENARPRADEDRLSPDRSRRYVEDKGRPQAAKDRLKPETGRRRRDVDDSRPHADQDRLSPETNRRRRDVDDSRPHADQDRLSPETNRRPRDVDDSRPHADQDRLSPETNRRRTDVDDARHHADQDRLSPEVNRRRRDADDARPQAGQERLKPDRRHRGQREAETSSLDDVEQDMKQETNKTEDVAPVQSPDPDSQDEEEFPPPPDDLLNYEEQEDSGLTHHAQDMPTSHIALKEENITQDEKKHLEKEEKDYENEENQPPRVRRPTQKSKHESESKTGEKISDITDEPILRDKNRDKKSDRGASQEEDSTFMSSFKKPVRNSQTVGEDFPSLAAHKQQSSSQPVSTRPQNESGNEPKTRKDKRRESDRALEAEGIVPIAGNLDMLDFTEEPAVRADARHQHSPDEEEHKARGRRRRDRSKDNKENMGPDRSRLRRQGYRDNQGSEDRLDREDEDLREGNTPFDKVARQGSLDSQEKREDRRRRKSSKERLKSRSSVENRASRDSLASKDFKDTRASRDSLASRGDSVKDYRPSKENLSRRQSRESENLSRRHSRDSNAASLDFRELEQEPHQGRRDRYERESAGRERHERDAEAENTDRARSEGRVRGRKSGHASQIDKSRQSSRRDDMDRLSAPPHITLQAASRESLDLEDSAPPLPPKQNRSMERLSEISRDSRRSRSRETLDEPPQPQNMPPDLPPKKNKKKTLSCVSGPEMEANERKGKKSKDRSSSKDRNRMPPPPAPPESLYNEEPRKQRGHQDSNHLHVPMDSFHRDSSVDASFEKDQRAPSSRSSRYRDETEPVFGEPRSDAKRNQSKSVEKDMAVTPPQTPRPARKISTSSYGSVSARIARSVSFEDGYTPTMSHAPSHNKSLDSLASEASFHSTGYRVRSYSGASETSVTSNPLNYEPWRAKAAAQRPRTSSRPHRSRSQGEPTYSAHSGRRRRSRPPSAGDTNRLYQPRQSRSRTSIPEAPSRSAVPSDHAPSRDPSMLADDSFSDVYSHGYASESMPPAPRRSQSERQPRRSRHREGEGDKRGSLDHLDSASGGENLEEGRSSKEGSPTKEAPSPTKDKKKKKKFQMPSFAKKKKDSKESTI